MRAVGAARRLLKAGARSIGFDVVRTQNSPALTLLGLTAFPIKTVLDVGANTGQFARQMRRLFPAATIYAFEPQPSAFERLKRWADSQHGRVWPLKLALGEETGRSSMYFHVEHDSSSSLLRSTALHTSLAPSSRLQKEHTVDIRRLDDVVAELAKPLEPPILIKLDVQGYEDRVLAGAHGTLRSAEACVLEVCLDHLFEGQAEFLGLATVLAKAGLTYAGNISQFYSADGHVMWLDALFIRRRSAAVMHDPLP